MNMKYQEKYQTKLDNSLTLNDSDSFRIYNGATGKWSEIAGSVLKSVMLGNVTGGVLTGLAAVGFAKLAATDTILGAFQKVQAQLNGAAIAIADIAAGGNIGTAAATVDIGTMFVVTQTTAAQVLTLPTPTVTTFPRMVTVTSEGAESFTIYGDVLATGDAGIYVYVPAVGWRSTR